MTSPGWAVITRMCKLNVWCTDPLKSAVYTIHSGTHTAHSLFINTSFCALLTYPVPMAPCWCVCMWSCTCACVTTLRGLSLSVVNRIRTPAQLVLNSQICSTGWSYRRRADVRLLTKANYTLQLSFCNFSSTQRSFFSPVMGYRPFETNCYSLHAALPRERQCLLLSYDLQFQ